MQRCPLGNCLSSRKPGRKQPLREAWRAERGRTTPVRRRRMLGAAGAKRPWARNRGGGMQSTSAPPGTERRTEEFRCFPAEQCMSGYEASCDSALYFAFAPYPHPSVRGRLSGRFGSSLRFQRLGTVKASGRGDRARTADGRSRNAQDLNPQARRDGDGDTADPDGQHGSLGGGAADLDRTRRHALAVDHAPAWQPVARRRARHGAVRPAALECGIM